MCATQEAMDFLEHVPEKIPFMGTSCCPAWSVMAKQEFPDYKDCISMALTPMTLTARMIKRHQPDAKVVFIGPCAAKKLEARRRTVRSDVDFVLTFEETMGLFNAKNIDLENIEGIEATYKASTDGRNFAVSGGVAKAVVNSLKKLEPGFEAKVVSAQGLAECKKMMMLAKAASTTAICSKAWPARAAVSPARAPCSPLPSRLPPSASSPSRRPWSCAAIRRILTSSMT